ncbi:MAG TPA: hypothetical protein VMR70_17095 [Flavisolibacter sp.]|nr:hypothetical protein [Flavisolibacter sp.]
MFKKPANNKKDSDTSDNLSLELWSLRIFLALLFLYAYLKSLP